MTCKHACRSIMAVDVYTRHRFSESLGSRLSGPSQKALQTMNEFPLFVNCCLIPLSKTCAFEFVKPRICKDGFISWGHGWVAPDKRHCKQWTSSHLIPLSKTYANFSLDVHTFIERSKSPKTSFPILTWLHFPLLTCVLSSFNHFASDDV